MFAAEVAAAGFADVRAQKHGLDVVFDGDGARYSDTLVAAGVADEVAALNGDDRARLVEAAARHLGPLVSDGKLHSASAANIVVARV